MKHVCYWVLAVGTSHSNAFITGGGAYLSPHTLHRSRASWKRPILQTGPTHLFMARPKRTDSSNRDNNPKSEPIQDDTDWAALVAAFQVYKAAYGDLKVPSRFTVPSMSPWPESAWGMKLGQRVAAIRATGKYVQEDVQRRKVLDDLGFLWRLRAPSPDTGMADTTSFDQIYSALLTYKQEILDKKGASPPIHMQQQQQDDDDREDKEEDQMGIDEDGSSSTFLIPRNFVVPNYPPWPEETQGLPLGKMLSTIRSKAFLKANPGAAEKLTLLGFELDGKAAANEAKFALVYKALTTYKQIYGDLLVPQPFVIPAQSTEWPEETWGLRLGARVNAIRSQGTFVKNNPDRKKLLNDLGFEWEISNISTRRKGRKRKDSGDYDEQEEEEEEEEVDEEKEEEDLGLQPSDEFEDDTDLDEETTTFFRQDQASNVNVKLPSNIQNNDEDYEIDYEDENQSEINDDDENSRLTTSTKEPPDVTPQRSGEEYQAPRDFKTTLAAAVEMAKAVGVIESTGEGKRVVKGKINKKFPWSIDDFGEDFVFEDAVEALTIYRRITGSFVGLETKDFIVPDPYMKTIESIDVEASARAAARIKQARLRGEDSDSLIAAEIQRMESELQGASKEHEWPEHLAGMKLGSIVNRIRDGSLEVKHLPERKAQLDAIGFDWGDPKRFLDVPFEKAMCAMFAYFLIRGDLFVYEDFVIPYDEPWPSILGGYELGKVVRRIQELQHFFEAYHPEKVQLLRMVEFSWFPELALPLNPEAGEESWEDIYVEGLGHPFYHLNEPSVEMVETLQAKAASSGLDGRYKSLYDFDVVKDYWKFGDITDSGKAEGHGRLSAAEWLWGNSFYQLSREHEAKYGPVPSLEMFRLLEDYVGKKISEQDFDRACLDVLKTLDLQDTRADAISLGIDVKDEDDLDMIMQKLKDDPMMQALESDPEYRRLIEDEIEAEEARIRSQMDDYDDDDDDDNVNEKEIVEDEDEAEYKSSSEEAYDESTTVLE